MAPSIALARDIPGASTMDGAIDTPGGPAPGTAGNGTIANIDPSPRRCPPAAAANTLIVIAALAVTFLCGLAVNRAATAVSWAGLAVTSRSESSGEKKTHKNARLCPMAAISRLARTPAAEPRSE